MKFTMAVNATFYVCLLLTAITSDIKGLNAVLIISALLAPQRLPLVLAAAEVT